MATFSFGEVQDLRSKCWANSLSQEDICRLAELCSFALANIPYYVFKSKL